MTVYVALHEERYPLAVFSTRELAQAWITAQEDPDYTFSIEVCEMDPPQ